VLVDAMMAKVPFPSGKLLNDLRRLSVGAILQRLE
jgi:hypothetical protein